MVERVPCLEHQQCGQYVRRFWKGKVHCGSKEERYHVDGPDASETCFPKAPVISGFADLPRICVSEDEAGKEEKQRDSQIPTHEKITCRKMAVLNQSGTYFGVIDNYIRGGQEPYSCQSIQ